MQSFLDKLPNNLPNSVPDPASITILAVDDQEEGLFALASVLKKHGYQVLTARNGKETLSQVQNARPDLVLLDVVMPEPNGYQVTTHIKSDPNLRYIPIVLLTANDSLDDLIQGFERGADDYIRKPFKSEELLARVNAVLRTRALYLELKKSHHENDALKAQAQERYSFHNIIGRSPEMQQVFSLIEKVKDAQVSVLITGESGTGKELVAKALHYSSPRSAQPFIAANCSAFNENLLESELFGHVKGSFTGAARDKIGLFEAADGGTFFLDELGEMSPALQVKLLRVLQDGSFTPVGATALKKVDVRIIAATNRDLAAMIRAGTFREDLYYRLNVVSLKLPALRDRSSDIPLLADYFLEAKAKKHKYSEKKLSQSALQHLMAYPWPGNIRELENEIERLVIMSGTETLINFEHLSQHIRQSLNEAEKSMNPEQEGNLKHKVQQLERQLIEQALRNCGGNKSEAARILGISRSSLLAKAKDYGLEE